jgi:excisionase family DNA binding protein
VRAVSDEVDKTFALAIRFCPVDPIGLISVGEAADVLGIGPAAVRHKINSGGLPAVKQGRDWRLEERVVRGLARQPAEAGRPLAAEMAWAVLLYASGDPEAAERMLDHPRYRSRARAWLRDHRLADDAARLRPRARSERFDVHPSELPRLRERADIMRSGLSGEGALGLVGGSGDLEAYGPESGREAIIDEHGLQPGGGPALLRWVADSVWARLPVVRSAPLAVGLVDLLESEDPRVRREARRALAA